MRGLAALITGALLILSVVWAARPAPTSAPGPQKCWVKLTFGLEGQVAQWDGRVSVTDGTILQCEPWSFESRDRFDPAKRAWACRTEVRTGRSASSFAEPLRGVLIQVEWSARTRLRVQTAQGEFEVPVAELEPGRPRLFVDGRASAERLGTARPVAETRTQDDFPALTVDGDGHRWLAWIGWDQDGQCDRLLVLDLDAPGSRPHPIDAGRLAADPQLVCDGDGRLWLFWSAPRGPNWDIWYARGQAGRWSGPEPLTSAPASDFHLRATAGPDGSLWLTWQSFRSGNSDIYAKCRKAGRWTEDIPVADSPANEWQPSISCGPDGRAWIAYDSYANGNYDVFLTSVTVDEGGRASRGKTIPVAASPDFEAHAWVEASDGRYVWVAYDAAGPNWGKDYTRNETILAGRYAEPLHASRRLELRAVADGKLFQPAVPLPQKLYPSNPKRVDHSYQQEVKRFYELPQLARDGRGRLWLLFRLNRQGYCGHPRQGAVWEVFATTFHSGRWLEPLLLPQSAGRQNQRVACSRDPAGNLFCAWSTGHHQVDRPNKLRVGSLPPLAGGGNGEPSLAAVELPKPEGKRESPVRSWEMLHNGRSYHVYFGDLHRHTDISLCTPTVDGCLVDAYRYALDAAGLDFLAVTNHTRDTDPYPWWRTQKACDLFYVPGRFATIYAYERSNSMLGGGHRNVFFLKPGWPVFRSDYLHRDQPRAKYAPDVALYPRLRGKQAFCIAHTPGYVRRAERGTWTFNDPQVEPLAELIQAYRRDYEQPGQPRWRPARVRGKIAEEASLWYALARGYRLGFIASSDHFSTHLSFACVWSEGPGREQIFEGLRARRTYAATDKIILEMRLGDALMGEQTKLDDQARLSIHARGTGPIAEIQVVHGGRIIWRQSPHRQEVNVQLPIRRGPDSPGFYYVRLRQEDDNMAWGSPVWVK